MKKAAKRAKLKTKTIVDALHSLNLIPSFSTSDFGGDVLPEAVLIRNILDEMLFSLTTLSQVLTKFRVSKIYILFTDLSMLVIVLSGSNSNGAFFETNCPNTVITGD